ncbi:TPA: DUF2158 domain-containing protein [Shewanella algae]|uniref:YodC family protein n=1 Tax=Shewanella algae TaxID=38313 RepID=UPI001C57404E|nr:DUF2158 domain-containing protein [Shewanella algae]HDS1213010.1 DUF2158 domain-containing protein [Shewanella algae]
MQKGDVVQLKSGGPYMTIYSVSGEKVGCVWFVENKPEHAAFAAETLELVEKE